MPEQTTALPHPLRRAHAPRNAKPSSPPEAAIRTALPVPDPPIPDPPASEEKPGASPAAFRSAFPDISAAVSAELAAQTGQQTVQQTDPRPAPEIAPEPAPEASPETWQQYDPETPQPADGTPAPAPDFTVAARVIAARRHAALNRSTVWEFFRQLVLFAVLLCAAFGLVFGILPCPDDDMMPRISAGDLLLYYRLDRAKAPSAGQIIVFDKDGDHHIGRVVAKEGDVVEITDDAQLKVNGSIVIESYIYESTPRYDELVSYPLALEEGSCFVLCDTREGGRDSRYFGAVTAAERRGRIITVLRRSNL